MFILAPYGIREATEKVGTFKDMTKEDWIKRDEATVHYPSKMNYNITDIYIDLLNFAALYLKIGGRLVCFVPIYRYLFKIAILY